jgi:hypothetical protein
MNWNGSWFDQSQSVVEQGAADLTSTATTTTLASRNRTADAAIASTATLTALATVVSEAAAALTSDCTLSNTADRLRATTVTLTSEFTASCSALDLDLAAADLVATVTLTASANVTKQLDATLTTQASQSTAVNVTRDVAAALNCQGFVVAVGLDLDLAQAALAVASQLSANARKTVAGASSLQTSATVTVAATRIKQFAATPSSAFSLTVSEQKIKDVFISGAIGQVYFRNTPVSPNYDAVIGDKFIRFDSATNFSTTSWALAFWSSGQGYVWHDGGGSGARSAYPAARVHWRFCRFFRS